jgi:hypothetical protein
VKKKPKKKIALPPRQWQINPSARVNATAKSLIPRDDKAQFPVAVE